MRIHGTLIKWNDERGFGFVALPQTRDEVFVHISAFPRDGVRPRIGETISFEVRTGPDGRKRAEAVERPAVRGTGAKSRTARSSQQRTPAGSVLRVVVVIALGLGMYSAYMSRRGHEAVHAIEPAVGITSQQFSCDGRTHCSQMTSCSEARYFLKHCPDTQMDGDGDGDPCEQQWCN
jgi:cold shock CspA family protein